MLAVLALGALSPAARADGDPGSDVLVYQNLFVAADADMSIPQQVALGDLLTAATRGGFPIRVAVIAEQDDLGAITALWGKPAAYARFLGIELSLAYTQRLLVVMPDGFGFYWQGHQTAAADRVLDRLSVATGGNGLAMAAETAVRALAAASGAWLPPAAKADGGAAGQGAHGSGNPAATSAPSGVPVPLIAGILLAALAAGAVGVWLTRRTGLRLPRLPGMHRIPRMHPIPRLPRSPRMPQLPRRPARSMKRTQREPRLAIPGSWLAAGFAGVAAVLIVLHAVIQPAGSAAQGGVTPSGALASNQNLDPGTTLSSVAPGFTLTDQFGQPVSLSSYRGKVVILAFNDSECTTVCPLTTAAMVDAKAMLGAAGSQVQLLGIDANPKANTVDDVLSYSELHGMLYQWRYLTGSLPQLRSVWKAYSVGVSISQNQIDHEPAIFVINQQGRLAKIYLTQLAYSAVGQLGQLLADEVAGLLPGHPPVRSHLSYAQVSPILPATASTLPGAGGGHVTLGPGEPGKARLYLFFATWDQEITSLGGQLDAINAYQSAAGAAGLPELTAIDEGSVEPSASALPNFLADLRQPLSYPVAIDSGGRVADGYGVEGEPWFVLTSPDGNTIWSWEVSTSGWLSRARLDRHLRVALASAAKSVG
jgi:cytochrome oxidase Cu insertion factor (SCO1/SenC/PrrC family)